MKNKILTLIFICFIGLFMVLNIVIPDNDISKTERRKLNRFPSFKFDSSWIKKLDKYFLDQFILRDELRSIKANYNYNVLGKLDNNDIYIKDNYIFKSSYPTNKDSINNFKNKTKQLEKLFNKENNIYMMVIPDKNYYLTDNNFLHIDYDYIYEETIKLNYNMIDIRNGLSLNDYYETDTHWKQENLDKVVKTMSNTIGFEYQEVKYNKNVYNDFYGVYYGQSAINRKPEKLTYLTNKSFDDVSVRYLENSTLNKIYNKEKLNGLDSYDVYLDGASSFIEILNNNASSNKELIIFRDSFGSSLAPLLINYYSKITLIDNRYISSENFKGKIYFTNQDILFMYSTLLINESGSLKG